MSYEIRITIFKKCPYDTKTLTALGIITKNSMQNDAMHWVSVSGPSMKLLTPPSCTMFFFVYVHWIKRLEDAHTCPPTVVSRIDYDLIREWILVDGRDWGYMVLMSVHRRDNSHSCF